MTINCRQLGAINEVNAMRKKWLIIYINLFFMLLITKSKLSVEKHNSQLIYSLPHAESCVYSLGNIKIVSVPKTSVGTDYIISFRIQFQYSKPSLPAFFLFSFFLLRKGSCFLFRLAGSYDMVAAEL